MHISGAGVGARRRVLGAAAIVYTLIAGSTEAADHSVVVAIPANGEGLDLRQPAAAQMLYERVEYAAYVACTRGNRVGLAPAADPKGCYEKALADAIRSANVPLLTQAYLATHSLREASARGIDVLSQIAAK
jgi:UrcA family protein